MKKWMLIFTSIVVSSVVSSYGATRFLYDLDGSQIPWTVCDSLVVVRHTAPPDTIESTSIFTLAFEGLIDDHAPKKVGLEFYEYGVVAGYDIDTLLAELRAHPDVVFAQAVYLVPWQEVWHAFDELLIQFKESTSAGERDSLLAAYSLTVVSAPSELHDSYLLRMTDASPDDVVELSNSIFETGLVLFATPNMYGRDELYSNDYYFPQQYYLNHDSSFAGKFDADIDAPEAWAFARGDTNIVIAIIDVAFDLDHEEFNPSKIAFPFDAAGINADSNVTDYDPRMPSGIDPSASVVVTWGHGTYVMGFAAAKRDNTIGVAGIAPDFYYMPIKYYDDHLGASNLSREQAWKWAIDHGADVINFSIGAKVLPEIEQQILRAHDSGIVVVCAAGKMRTIAR